MNPSSSSSPIIRVMDENNISNHSPSPPHEISSSTVVNGETVEMSQTSPSLDGSNIEPPPTTSSLNTSHHSSDPPIHLFTSPPRVILVGQDELDTHMVKTKVQNPPVNRQQITGACYQYNIYPDINSIQFSTSADLPPVSHSDESQIDTNIDDQLLTFNYDDLPTFPLRPSYLNTSDTEHCGRLATQIITFKPSLSDPYSANSVPIYQTATFAQPSIEKFGPYDYTRSGNPTRTAVEELLASLEGAHAAFGFVSGMAAISSAVRLLSNGDVILTGDDVYGGTHRLFSKIVPQWGISVRFIDTSIKSNVEEALVEMEGRVKMVYLESPSNPQMKICDIRGIATLAKEHCAICVVDSTMMSPVLMNPIRLGADLVVHSATKFLCGHSDTMAGFVCCATESLARKIAFYQNAEGTSLSPFDCWLTLRGLKTLSIRFEKSQENAQTIVKYLSTHPLVKNVYYPGILKGVRNQEEFNLHTKQARGGGSVLSFTTGSVKLSRKVCDFCKLFKISVSFGGCNSLIEMPCVLSHASIPKELRKVPEDLIRLSIGIEHVDDILEDLSQALKGALISYQEDR